MSPPAVLGALCLLLVLPSRCGFRDGRPEPQPTAPAAAASAVADTGRLIVHLGCDDTFVAHDPRGTAVLAVTVAGIRERSRSAELPYREKLAVGSPEVEVRLEQGAHLVHPCTDVFERPPQVERTWTGVAGTATIEITARRPDLPSGGGNRPTPVDAVLRLGPTVLARQGDPDERLRLPPLEIAASLGVPAGG